MSQMKNIAIDKYYPRKNSWWNSMVTKVYRKALSFIAWIEKVVDSFLDQLTRA